MINVVINPSPIKSRSTSKESNPCLEIRPLTKVATFFQNALGTRTSPFTDEELEPRGVHESSRSRAARVRVRVELEFKNIKLVGLRAQLYIFLFLFFILIVKLHIYS